ncbi:MAG: hypothetical protein ACTHJL_02115 [Amnibacterium sp.]
MSTQDLTKRKRGARHGADAPRAAAPEKRTRPIVGGYAQVSLLPREMLDADRRRAIRRRLVGGVVLTAVVVAGGVAGSVALAMSAQSALAVQAHEQAQLAQRMQRYLSVEQLQSQLALDKAAARVGSSTAIDWDPQIDRIDQALPSSYQITAISTDSATPTSDFSQGSTPLDKPRAASVTITVQTTSISALPGWIASVTALPEVADASPVVSSADSCKYTVVLTVHLTTKAYITPLKTGVLQ